MSFNNEDWKQQSLKIRLNFILILSTQLSKRKNELVFNKISDDLLLEADVKHARQNIRVSLSDIELILDEANGREIQSFNIVLMSKFKAKFSSNKGFITEIESMVLEYYAGIVQYLTNWDRPAPKL